MKYFYNEYYNDETNETITAFYYISKNNYCYRAVKVNGTLTGRVKRISETEYINAYDVHINA